MYNVIFIINYIVLTHCIKTNKSVPYIYIYDIINNVYILVLEIVTILCSDSLFQLILLVQQ